MFQAKEERNHLILKLVSMMVWRAFVHMEWVTFMVCIGFGAAYAASFFSKGFVYFSKAIPAHILHLLHLHGARAKEWN